MTAAIDYNVLSFEVEGRKVTESRGTYTAAADGKKERDRQWFEYRRLLRRKLDPTEYVILEVLEDHASEINEWWSWASYETIMRETPIQGRATIAKVFKVLTDELGIVEAFKEQGRATKYRPVYRDMLTSSIIERVYQFRNETRPVQKLNGGSSKIERLPVQKLNANEPCINDPYKRDHAETEVSEASSASPEIVVKQNGKAIEDNNRRLIDNLRSDYEEAQAGRGATKQPHKDAAGVVAHAFLEVFKKDAEIGHLMKMANQLGSKWVLIEVILSLTGQTIMDDPHAYLQKVVTQKLAREDKAAKGKGGWIKPKPEAESKTTAMPGWAEKMYKDAGIPV